MQPMAIVEDDQQLYDWGIENRMDQYYQDDQSGGVVYPPSAGGNDNYYPAPPPAHQDSRGIPPPRYRHEQRYRIYAQDRAAPTTVGHNQDRPNPTNMGHRLESQDRPNPTSMGHTQERTHNHPQDRSTPLSLSHVKEEPGLDMRGVGGRQVRP